MSNVVPLAVSGQIAPNQRAILMSIVDSTPYYLVTDVNGTPYFQPLYQDATTGLAVFTQYATHVNVVLGRGTAGVTTAIITDLKVPGGGPFPVDPNLLKVVGANSLPGASRLIPIENLSYANPTLVTCGYQYVISTGVGFFITTNWSATPNSQSIGSVQQQTPTTSFFVFPIDNLVNSHDQPASASVYQTIYNDVLGVKLETFLFSSHDAWLQGAGEPYYFCSDSQCGPNCVGTCYGTFTGCHRLKNSDFACTIAVSWQCKIMAILPFFIPAVLSMIAFLVVFLTNKFSHVNPATAKRIVGSHAYVFSTKVKIVLSVLLVIPAMLLILMLLLVTIDNGDTNWYLRRVCSLTRDYK